MSRALLDEKVKSWDTLEKEMVGVTSLMCEQDFNATKQDSFDDNGWGEEDEDGLIIGEDKDFGYDTYWKLDTVWRMLDENLDYGKFNEGADERDDTSSDNYDSQFHSEMMGIRDAICEVVSSDWVFETHIDYETNEMVNGKVNSLETAQTFCNELVDLMDKDSKAFYHKYFRHN